MNPALLKVLLGILGPQLLVRIFGGTSDQERLRQHIENLLAPEAVAARANTNQAEWYRSPAYGAAQAAAIAAGRQAEESVSRAGAGVTSGTDILRGAAAAGLGSATLSRFNAEAYQQSRELAQRQAEAAAQSTLGVGVSPNLPREALGVTLNFLGPLLADWLRKRPAAAAATTQPRAQGGWYDTAGQGVL